VGYSGFYAGGATSEYATEWTGGGAINLGVLPGTTVSVAEGINDAGQVVGYSFIAPPIPEPSTWAMLLLGFAGLGFLGSRSARAPRDAV
jgi:uncharacterized membrane protein